MRPETRRRFDVPALPRRPATSRHGPRADSSRRRCLGGTQVMATSGDLNHAQLVELLIYDPDTGSFCWRKDRGARKRGSPSGYVNCYGYRCIVVCGRRYYASRLAWFYVTGRWPDGYMDHRNMVVSDDRFCNLREATRSQNMANVKCRRDNTIGLKGVRRIGGRWQARIRRGGRQDHIGCFGTPEEAHAAYVLAAEQQFGDFANPGLER